MTDLGKSVAVGEADEGDAVRLVPSERYTSVEYLRAELEQLWPRVWLMAGLSADLPAPGSYFTFAVGAESLLVVRQAEGARAFHNVCLHRGRQLCEPGIGRVSVFRCPYHGWEWQPDGKLARVSDAESFPHGVPPGATQLKEVRCAEWAGFVWVSLSDDAPPLRDYLGEIAPLIEAYAPSHYALVEDQTLDLPCNWKVCIDAFNEVYHLKAVHPELLGLVDDVSVRTDLFGRHGRLIVPFFVPSPRKRDRETIDPALRGLLEQAGMTSTQINGSALEVRRRIQAHLRMRERAGEVDWSALSDDQLSDNNHFHIFPNFQLDLYALHMQTLRARPHPTDPGRMLLDQQRFERIASGVTWPPRPAHEQMIYGQGSLGTVSDQDMFNLVRVQLGMQSRGFEGLVLGDQEQLIRHLHRGLDAYIGSKLDRDLDRSRRGTN